ncbi:MAG: hypothetical protein O9302_07750 [Cyclobacteriaceae bacterium]|jgi:hypothetical protein|nr:hypothetical protein [Cytophagales bacterium]MCZ8327936.1 hypothetical protein [Cyclobacteriaceae bacterium]
MEFIKQYFSAEKSESFLAIVIGTILLSFSIYILIKWGDAFYKGFAVPVVVVALIQIVVGSVVYFRTDKQVQTLMEQFEVSPTEFAQAENQRMNIVMKNFSVYKWIEVAFVVSGLLLIIFFKNKEFVLGVGVGLLLQGALMLSADIFAERRGNLHLKSVDKIMNDKNV